MTDQTSLHQEIARLKASDPSKSKSGAPYGASRWRPMPPIAHPLIAIDGRVVQLCLTGRRLDTVGHRGIEELFAKATSGEPGALEAAAEMLEIFSGGEITQAEVMAAPIRLDIAVAKLYEEWMLAQWGPPKGRLHRWWAHLTNRPEAVVVG